MYDIHSHLLPNVPGDDGASSHDMTYRMARQSLNAGFSHVLATSHFIAGEPYGKREDLIISARVISKFLQTKGMDLQIVPAHEAYLMPELIHHIKKGEVILIANRYLLLELPMSGWMSETFSLIADLQELGIKIIIAHPERCSAITEKPELAVELIDSGAYLQLNLGSLKSPSSSTGRTARKLLKYKMYHFVGSDAHNDTKRSPQVGDSLEIMKSLTSQDYFERLTRLNPERAFKGFEVDNSFDETWSSFEDAKLSAAVMLKESFWKRLEAWRYARR
jgi:protein-tyrosine phosphatase